MNKPFVSILIGSKSDLPIVQSAIDVLNELNVKSELTVTSAHRTPENTRKTIADAESRGAQVFIAAAGMAAHLAGTVAAHTLKPVIGIPINASPLNGLDALLSTVQMPGGIPVACVAIDKAGAKNAAFLSAQILALHDEELAKALKTQRDKSAKQVLESNA